MNREDIIRMAFEAYGDHLLKSVQDFAAFAYDKGVEAEREKCAKEAIAVLNKRYMGDNNREDMEVRRCVEDLKKHFGVEE